MKILVVGAGTIGSIVGGYLSGEGYDVLLIDGWAENVNKLNRDGLKISGTRGEHHFNVKALEIDKLNDLNENFDVILISVKTYDTPSILSSIRRFISSDTIVISTQNGINEEYLSEELGSSHVIGAVTEMSGYMQGPGSVVESRKNGGFVIGELDGRDSHRLKEISQIMSACGNIKLSDNIMGILWSKLIWNSMLNPLTAISGLGTGSILQNDSYRKLALEVGKEGFSVSKKRGIKLEPLALMGIDPRRFDPESEEAIKQEEASLVLLPEPLDKMPSMAQDIKNGRPTEIDYINGMIVDIGKKLDVKVPVNEAVVKTLHEVENKNKIQSTKLLDDLVELFVK